MYKLRPTQVKSHLHRTFFPSFNHKDKSQHEGFIKELDSTAMQSNRISCDDGVFYSALSSMVATNHMWLLSASNVARATEEMEF